MEENVNPSKDGIHINQVGDVIGVNVYGSDNIIGKNIIVYQQSIHSAKIPYTIIKVDNNNTAESLQQVVACINLKLYEKDKEYIPFIPPNKYHMWKDKDKLLLYGRSGSGKSRTLFEIIKDYVLNFDNVYVICPRNFGESVQDETAISKLVSRVGEKDILVWDNFPDGVQAEISVDHGLEILMAISRVKHFICTINPVRLELYKKHLWRLNEYLSFHEVIFDLYELETTVKSYGENISRFKGAYRESVEEYRHDISEVLVKKEPTPLVVLNYYEKILNSVEPNKSKTINNDAVQMAKELLVPSEYYANQFVYVINERPGDAEFLYTLKLCYDLGLERKMARIHELQGEIFKSSAGDPTTDLSTWVFQLDKSCYMYDVARNVIKYTDHQKIKILNYLTSKTFLSSISPASYNLFGQFVGENILFLESGSQNELVSNTLTKLIKSNADFERGLAIGLSKKLLTLEEVQLSKIFKIVEERKNFAYSLGRGLGHNLLQTDDVASSSTSDLNLTKKLHIPPELQSRLLSIAIENHEFGIGLGYGLGYNFVFLEEEFRTSIFNIINKKSIWTRIRESWNYFGYYLYQGLGSNFMSLEQDLQNNLLHSAEGRKDFGYGLGSGLAESFILLHNTTQNKILNDQGQKVYFTWLRPRTRPQIPVA